MDNNIRRSRIHVLVEELNRIADENIDVEPFKKYHGEVFIKEVDELGYRILSVYSLEQQDLLLLPHVSEVQKTTILSLEKSILDNDLSQEEIYVIRIEIRAIEKDIIHAYSGDVDQPWFHLINHNDRLIVWNEAPGHPMNQYAETFRENSLLRIRAEYEIILWSFQLQNGGPISEALLIDYVTQKGLGKIAAIHLKMIHSCIRGANLKGGEVLYNHVIQIINTYLLQAMEINDTNVFRNCIFWAKHDRVRWELGWMRGSGMC